MCQNIPAPNEGGFWAAGNYLCPDLRGSCRDIYLVKTHGAVRLVRLILRDISIYFLKVYREVPVLELQNVIPRRDA